MLGLMVAGACGAVLRYLVDHVVQRRSGSGFPLGTLVINVCGSLVLGVLTGRPPTTGCRPPGSPWPAPG